MGGWWWRKGLTVAVNLSRIKHDTALRNGLGLTSCAEVSAGMMMHTMHSQRHNPRGKDLKQAKRN